MKVGSNSLYLAMMLSVTLLSDVISRTEYEEAEARNVMAENELEMMWPKESPARAWLEEVNRMSRRWNEKVSLAIWNYETNLTKSNSEKLSNLSRSFDRWTLSRAKIAREYLEGKSLFDRDTLRQLQLWSMSATPEDTDISKRIYAESEYMAGVYNSAQVCRDSRCFHLEPDLIKIMAESRDTDELLWAWHGWRNATGRQIRNSFQMYIELMNLGAKQNGYPDFGGYLRAKHYEFPSFIESLAEELWTEMKPLYSQLHAYVRRRLQEFYGPAVFGRCLTTIPAHILGNMWAQSWSDIYDLVVPFPDAKYPDIDRIVKEQNLDPLQLQRKVEEFYVSLGLDPMPSEFWRNSIFEKPSNSLMDCHPTAFDFHKRQDFRVKLCTGNVSTSYYWRVGHHEMGHVAYYMAYREQPDIYRRPANPAFDEAVGDTITMSSLSLGHMQRVGFIKDTRPHHYENDINLLLYEALEKIPMIAFSYTLDKWRWDVYRGVIPPSKYTEAWISMRRHLQGIHPPVSRSEFDFDPGSKYHVAVNIPYIRYFFSAIVQYQIHEALCQAAGESGPMHHCDIYNSKEAGQKLLSFMQLGSSLPWPESLEILTGSLSISTRAINTYYAPLMEWLTEQNRDENNPAWNPEDNDGC